MKADAEPARSDAAGHSAFRGQLQRAIQAEKKGEDKNKKDSASEGDAPPPADKKEDRSLLPAILIAIAVTLPNPTPAGLGLPTMGVEPGPDSNGAPKQTDPIAVAELATAASSDEPAPAAASVPQIDPRINPPAPRAEARQTEFNVDLAFALKLTAPAPVRETEPTAVIVQPVMVKTAMPESAAPVVPATPMTRSAAPLPQSAAPTISSIPQRTVTAAANDSGRPSSDRDASDPAPSKEPPKLERPRPAVPEPPNVEPEPLRGAGANPPAVNSAHSEAPLQTTSAVQPNVIATSTAPAPPQTANSVTATPGPEQGVPGQAAVRAHPAPEVTDVSVTVPLPRADAAGDDRVAIRMVQRGTEIHVSVRTPDSQLAQSLRQDLGKLATGLDQAGFRTETWRPAVTAVAASSQSSARYESSQGAPNRDTAGSDARSGGQNSRGSEEQKRREQEARPRWVAELEQYKNQ